MDFFCAKHVCVCVCLEKEQGVLSTFLDYVPLLLPVVYKDELLTAIVSRFQ